MKTLFRVSKEIRVSMSWRERVAKVLGHFVFSAIMPPK
jgi:hypothetical protein